MLLRTLLIALIGALGVQLSPKLVAQTSLDRATETLLKHDGLAHATLGIAVLDLSSGSTITSLNAGKSLVPASLMKVTTTATALEVLGGDYRFETQLCYNGSIVDGTLRGDLIIVGGGDPSLGAGRPDDVLDLDAVLARWADAVEQAGIRAIEGRVLGDESLDPGAEPSPYWQWNDIGNYYGAGPGALMINENQYTLKLQRTAKVGGQPKIIGYEPDPGQLRWTNELRSGPSGSGDQSYIFGAPGTYDRVIRGTIPAGSGTYEVEGSLPEPARHAADWLKETLESRGISVSKEATASRAGVSSSYPVIDTYRSPPLRELIKLTNYRSVNVFAEAIYATLGRKLGAGDDPAEIGEAIVSYWEQRGLDTDGFEQVDGSGLGMRNMISAQQLAFVLRLSQRASTGLKETLPRVGQEGTVRSVLRGNARAQRIHAKSGTLKRSRGFCGYATMANGREIVFVIMANNYTGKGSSLRRAMGEWMRALVE